MINKETLNVLLVEDVEDDMIIIEDHLSQADYHRYHLTWVQEKAEALEQINRECYDVILLDHDLVGYTGMQLLTEARRAGNRKAIIFLSGSKNPQVRKDALTHGACGFLIKGEITSAILEMSILFAIERAEHLASLEVMVDERTQELQRTLHAMNNVVGELKDTQDKMVEQETMANLGSLVAGVAHEINTPIGVGVTAASHLWNKTEEIHGLVEQGSITRNELDEYLRIASESSTMILSNLKRAAELIRSFKRIAVDQAGHQRRVFNLCQTLNDVVMSLSPRLKKTQHHIELDCPDNISLDSLPGVYSQVLTNLIDNSLIHGFAGIEQGHINIEVRQHSEQLHIHYSDDGNGMPKEVQDKIFVPFFTTRGNNGGSGLGGSIIFNSIAQLGGKIAVTSTPGKGTQFDIRLPCHLPDKSVTAR